MKPMDIEKESFAIIEKELTTDIPAEYKPVVKRVIHTTADFSYETSMTFSKGVIEEALKAIKEGVDIVTDTNMAKSGISHKMAEKFSCSLNCYMADSDVASEAAKREVTRATVSVEKAAKDNPDCIMVVGNAPTALMRIRELYDEGIFVPRLVIGVPVGFVNVASAKEEIIESGMSYIVARGRKGGSNVAAAKAAAYMLLSGREVKEIKVITPMGVSLTLPVIDIDIKEDKVICAIKKDSGDDPDVTNGIKIYAQVTYVKEDIMRTINTDGVIVDGGIGVGRVTKKGLKCAVGEAAINPVPLKMIKEAVAEAAESYSYEGSLKVIISAPKGVDIAKKTFNPNLGITGGISILGTTGIVEPMSEQALIDTIKTEINMHIAQGEKVLLVAPGNYGQDFLLNTLNIELKRSIKCSNYIGNTIDMVCDAGAKAMLLVGHIGKLVKLGAGIMNTHSKVADGRMEVLSACAIRAGADNDTALKILDCITTEAALEILKKSDILEKTMYQLTLRIEDVLQRRSSGKIVIGAIVFSNEYGILGKTPAADKLLELIKSS